MWRRSSSGPDRRGRMLVVPLDQPELPAEEACRGRWRRAPSGSRPSKVSRALLDRHPMVEVPSSTSRTRAGRTARRRRRPPRRADARRGRRGAAETTARRCARSRRPRSPASGAALGVREPVAQTLFRQLVELEVPPMREAPGEEHRRHLGRRLADLGVELLRLLDHEDRDSGWSREQHRGRGAAEGPPEDDDVVALVQRAGHHPAPPEPLAMPAASAAAWTRAPDRPAAAGRACRGRRAAAPAGRRRCAESCARRACRGSARRRSRTSPPRGRRRRPRAGPCAALPVRPRRGHRRPPPRGGRAGGSRPRAAARSCL